MSVRGEKSQYDESSEQTESLQAELTSLTEQLQSQTDDAERERLESLIADIHAKILQIAKPTASTSKRDEPRKSSRERKLSPKMQELKGALECEIEFILA